MSVRVTRSLAVTVVLLLAGCEPEPSSRVRPSPPAPAEAPPQASAPAEPEPQPTVAAAEVEPHVASARSPFEAEPEPGPAAELPPEAFAAAPVAELAGGSRDPELPPEWLKRWRGVGHSSIGTIARGGQIGQRVRVEGYLARHGNGPTWGLLFVDFEDYLVDTGTPRGRLIALEFEAEQSFPEGRWTSVVGRVVADHDADRQSPYSTFAHLDVEDYLVTEER